LSLTASLYELGVVKAERHLAIFRLPSRFRIGAQEFERALGLLKDWIDHAELLEIGLAAGRQEFTPSVQQSLVAAA
jgi:hypothetical protein